MNSSQINKDVLASSDIAHIIWLWLTFFLNKLYKTLQRFCMFMKYSMDKKCNHGERKDCINFSSPKRTILNSLLNSPSLHSSLLSDCSDIQRNHLTGEKSGLYKINPSASLSSPPLNGVVEVYCDQGGFLGGWTLIQQRAHGGVNFNRSWADYQEGFGGVDSQGKGEVWLGLKHLHILTREESMLRVELEDWEGEEATAEYTLKVGSEAEGYRLTVAEYTGDAGDALVKGESSLGSKGSPGLGSFLSHEGMKFSTFDKDNDQWEESCAEMYGGGWWYNNCQRANLNGVYYKGGKYDPGSNAPYEIENGVVWLTYRPADYSLKTTRMKIRPLAMA